MQDIFIPLGVAGGVPYVAFVLSGLWFKDKKISLYLGASATALTLVGLYISPEGGEEWKILLNRSYAIFAIWVVATGVYYQKKILGKLEEYTDKLKNSNSELEKQVAARTNKLAEALQHQKELNEMKSRFVTTASHEFRTPLSSILSSVSLIRKYAQSRDKEKQQKHIERIKHAVQNMETILSDFLSIEKLEEGRIQVQFDQFNLNELCNEVIAQVEVTKKPGQTFDFINNDVEIVQNLDSELLRIVLVNLLSNAIKFSQEDMPIELLTSRQDGYLVIEIKDKGIGIAENEVKYVFEKFFRAKNAENIQGTGLGLNIAKQHVEIMGGSIDFSSVLDNGSVCTVKLPHR